MTNNDIKVLTCYFNNITLTRVMTTFTFDTYFVSNPSVPLLRKGYFSYRGIATFTQVMQLNTSSKECELRRLLSPLVKVQSLHMQFKELHHNL